MSHVLIRFCIKIVYLYQIFDDSEGKNASWFWTKFGALGHGELGGSSQSQIMNYE